MNSKNRQRGKDLFGTTSAKGFQAHLDAETEAAATAAAASVDPYKDYKPSADESPGASSMHPWNQPITREARDALFADATPEDMAEYDKINERGKAVARKILEDARKSRAE
jgi:hypothetical protein